MIEFVKALEGFRPGQIRELYKDGDRYVAVSTVNLSESTYDAGSRAIVEMAGLLVGTAVAGEETMAFECDAHGEPFDFGSPLAEAHGAGSRQVVLDELSA